MAEHQVDMTEGENAYVAVKNTLSRASGRMPEVGDVYKHLTGHEYWIKEVNEDTDHRKSTVTFAPCTGELFTWPIRNFAEAIHQLDTTTGDAELTPQFMLDAFPNDMYPTDKALLPVEVDLFEDVDEDCLDEDDEWPYVGLIIPRLSDVIYVHQAGGTSCRLCDMEGEFLALPFDPETHPLIRRLHDLTLDLHDLEGRYDVATAVHEVLDQMGLQLDFDRLADSCEAWLHVIYLWSSPTDLYSRARAVLVWPNSD